MSISSEIARIAADRNTLRNKGVSLGISKAIDGLDAISAAFDGIEDRGAVDAEVQEGQTYTVPKGYHNGSGTVRGVAGGGNYNLQAKTATPTKAEQNITPDQGYYGMSAVTVNPIPDTYQDVSSVTATASDVLANKLIIGPDGSSVAGTMPNNGAVSMTIDGLTTTSAAVPPGYTAGGTVSLTDDIETALSGI